VSNATEPKPQRTPRSRDGKFLPGVSPNPGGRKTSSDVKAAQKLATDYSPEAIETTVTLMRTTKSQRVRLECAKVILTFGCPKPEQSVAITATRSDAPGGNPDAARARLEALIQAEQAKAALVASTNGETVALPVVRQSLPPVSADEPAVGGQEAPEDPLVGPPEGVSDDPDPDADGGDDVDDDGPPDADGWYTVGGRR
jgi:hypothetical protein